MFFERRIALTQEQLVWWSGGLHLAAGMRNGGRGSIDGDLCTYALCLETLTLEDIECPHSTYLSYDSVRINKRFIVS